MTTHNEETYADFTTSELLSMAKEAGDIAEKHKKQRDLMVHEIIKRMEENNQTDLYDEHYTVKIKYPATEYNYEILRELHTLPENILPRERLHDIYTPPHQVLQTVAEKWNMTKARGLMKLGKQVQDIINKARKERRIRDLDIEYKNLST